MTVCKNKRRLAREIKKKISTDFKGGNISSDAGLLLINKIDSHLELSNKVSNSIVDYRNQSKIEHTFQDLLKQRMYQIIAGYEDCIDANSLRNDPIFKTICGRLSETDSPLAGQSTLSRLENNISTSDLHALSNLMVDVYISRKKRDGIPKKIVIDIDPTDDPCHGKQEFSLFHGYYWQNQYFPLLVFDACSGDIICPLLRPGVVHASQGADSLLRRILKKIRCAFPSVEITIRGDAGFGLPKMYDFCENGCSKFMFGLAGNPVLKKKTEEIEKKLLEEYERSKIDQKEYITFNYKADTWKHDRVVIAKIERNHHGGNIRFVVTNIDFETSEAGCLFYTERGQCENFIKDLKNHLYLDRLSCSSYKANWFRMLMSCFGYVIMQEIRLLLKGTEFEKYEINTIRLKLIKIGARVIESTRRVLINISSSFIFKEEYEKIYCIT